MKENLASLLLLIPHYYQIIFHYILKGKTLLFWCRAIGTTSLGTVFVYFVYLCHRHHHLSQTDFANNNSRTYGISCGSGKQ